MRYGSICSGIEAAMVAWETLGWTPAFFSEIDPFCSSLLNQRYPGVPNYGDFTQLLDPAHPVHNQPPIDVLVGGTPCQDFSVAGLRAGVAGARGGLTLDFCRLVDVLRPRWVVWENVPGVLSSDGGRALGAFTGALAELGYGFAWRVLDAQYFGLAQRRKRVFVVGHAGGQPGRPGAVLLEPEGVRGDPPSRKQARKVAPADAGCRAACGGERSSLAIAERGQGDGLSLEHQPRIGRNGRGQLEPICPTLNGAVAFNDYQRTEGSVITLHSTSYSIRADAMREGVAKTPSADAKGRVRLRDPGMGLYENVAPTLDCGQAHGVFSTAPTVITLQDTRGMDKKQKGKGWSEDDLGYTVDAMATQGVAYPSLKGTAQVVEAQAAMSVRRLTPRECERLQGFPDDYTLVPYRKGLSADSNRYKALGNSMAVPVMRWIGARIALVEALDEVAEEATAPEPIPSTVGAGRKWRHPNADLTIQNENNPTQSNPSRKWSRNP